MFDFIGTNKMNVKIIIFRPVCYFKPRIKIHIIRMKCASRKVRNLSNRSGQKSAKFTKGRKSGKYV